MVPIGRLGNAAPPRFWTPPRIAGTAVLLVLASVFFYGLYLSFFPDDVCDCKTSSYLTGMRSTRRMHRQTWDEGCLHRYVYSSGKYTDCAYLGSDCVNYLESKDVRCTPETCGTLGGHPFDIPMRMATLKVAIQNIAMAEVGANETKRVRLDAERAELQAQYDALEAVSSKTGMEIGSERYIDRFCAR